MSVCLWWVLKTNETRGFDYTIYFASLKWPQNKIESKDHDTFDIYKTKKYCNVYLSLMGNSKYNYALKGAINSCHIILSDYTL